LAATGTPDSRNDPSCAGRPALQPMSIPNGKNDNDNGFQIIFKCLHASPEAHEEARHQRQSPWRHTSGIHILLRRPRACDVGLRCFAINRPERDRLAAVARIERGETGPRPATKLGKHRQRCFLKASRDRAGASLEACGRLCDLVMPRSASRSAACASSFGFLQTGWRRPQPAAKPIATWIKSLPSAGNQLLPRRGAAS
jgi:hypothetical protein